MALLLFSPSPSVSRARALPSNTEGKGASGPHARCSPSVNSYCKCSSVDPFLRRIKAQGATTVGESKTNDQNRNYKDLLCEESHRTYTSPVTSIIPIETSYKL